MFCNVEEDVQESDKQIMSQRFDELIDDKASEETEDECCFVPGYN